MADHSVTGHYSDALWADFAREMAEQALRQEMQAHLDSGCEACQSTLGQFRAVVRMAIEERRLIVPEDLVRQARQVFERKPTASGWIGDLEVILARLVAETRLDWQPAGVRSGAGTAGIGGSRLLYRAGDYAVDLRIEPPAVGDHAEIVGQIANETRRDETLEAIPVQMMARGKILSETQTNRFGEFLIEYPDRQNTILRFALRHRGQRIDLPLGIHSRGPREGIK